MEVKSMDDEVAKAQVEIWEYVFGFTPMAVVKCAIELQIADVIESHGGAMPLTELSSALGCSPTALGRIMRYLVHRGFFKLESPSHSYIQTPLSRLLLRKGGDSMADFILLESSPVMVAPWGALSSRVLVGGDRHPPFEAAHGEDVWGYASANPGHSKLINDAMACHARRAVSVILEECGEVFGGVSSLVDVGGGNGTAVGAIVKACPWIRGINYDLPHVVGVATPCDGVEHVAGDMFECVPKADAAFLMWVLHDWSDEECVQILRRCREAIPKEGGKVMIVEAVVAAGDEERYGGVRLALDMVMLAHTEKGKERGKEEWEYVVKEAGFSTYTIKHMSAITSLIIAYP